MPPSPFPDVVQHPGGLTPQDMRFPRPVDLEQFPRSERTRMSLMEATAHEVYEKGYQAASLADILDRAGATKGALYHHFPDKRSLVIAAMHHFFATDYKEVWVDPIAQSDDPISTLKAIIGFMHSSGAMEGGLKHGCPLINLTEEMAQRDEEFRTLIEEFNSLWRNELIAALKRAQTAGNLREDVDAEGVALLITAVRHGVMSQAKVARDLTLPGKCARTFFAYLDSLRPQGAH